MRLDSARIGAIFDRMEHEVTLSEQLRDFVRREGRSLYALAIASGVDRGQIVRFMNADRELTLPAASKLCAALALELRPARRRSGKGS